MLSAADADGTVVRSLVDVGGVYSVSRFGVAVPALLSWWMRSSRAFRAHAWHVQAPRKTHIPAAADARRAHSPDIVRRKTVRRNLRRRGSTGDPACVSVEQR